MSRTGLSQYIPFGHSLHVRIPSLPGVLWLKGIKLGNSGTLTRVVVGNVPLEKDGTGTNGALSSLSFHSPPTLGPGETRVSFWPTVQFKAQLLWEG